MHTSESMNQPQTEGSLSDRSRGQENMRRSAFVSLLISWASRCFCAKSYHHVKMWIHIALDLSERRQ
jgi:hypothetical protein